MVGRLTSGLVLAVVTALVIGLSDALGLDLQHVGLLGAALGGILALVPHTPDWGRPAGFLVGFVVAWIGFALRAAMLPDSATGRAFAALVVIAVLTAVAVLSAGRLPLWSSLLGAAAIVGAYEEIYTNAPSQFVAESPGAATAVLLAAALGFLVMTLVPVVSAAPDRSSRGAHRAPTDGRAEPGSRGRTATEEVDALMSGEGQ